METDAALEGETMIVVVTGTPTEDQPFTAYSNVTRIDEIDDGAMIVLTVVGEEGTSEVTLYRLQMASLSVYHDWSRR